MTRLASFFKESDTRLGVFYPEHYIMEVFPSYERAQEAFGKLRSAGFSDDEARVMRGSELLRLMDEEKSLLGFVMTEVSRFLDTEANYSDLDVRDARHGAAILAVYCPDERSRKSAWNVIQDFNPVRAVLCAGRSRALGRRSVMVLRNVCRRYDGRMKSLNSARGFTSEAAPSIQG